MLQLDCVGGERWLRPGQDLRIRYTSRYPSKVVSRRSGNSSPRARVDQSVTPSGSRLLFPQKLGRVPLVADYLCG